MRGRSRPKDLSIASGLDEYRVVQLLSHYETVPPENREICGVSSLCLGRTLRIYLTRFGRQS